ncbi:MAG: cell division protein FtsQ/DivIB, partial [Solirubrobacterales bacterium]
TRRTARRPAPKRSSRRTGRPSRRRGAGSSLPRAALAAPLSVGAGLIRLARGALAATSWRGRIALIAATLAVLSGGYFFYLRDSSLVAVTDVEVVGVRSGEPQAIIAEFDAAAREMSTLHVDRERLDGIAAGFPTIESVSADANFPHGLRIEVTERPPVLIARAGGQVVAVAADGALLAGIEIGADAGLPTLELERAPTGSRLEGTPLEQALAVGAAPDALRGLIERVTYSDQFGVELVLRGGIPVRFGNGSRAAQKWAAAATVLADRKLDTLTYVDVRVPERAAAGGAAAGLMPEPDPPA